MLDNQISEDHQVGPVQFKFNSIQFLTLMKVGHFSLGSFTVAAYVSHL